MSATGTHVLSTSRARSTWILSLVLTELMKSGYPAPALPAVLVLLTRHVWAEPARTFRDWVRSAPDRSPPEPPPPPSDPPPDEKPGEGAAHT